MERYVWVVLSGLLLLWSAWLFGRLKRGSRRRRPSGSPVASEPSAAADAGGRRRGSEVERCPAASPVALDFTAALAEARATPVADGEVVVFEPRTRSGPLFEPLPRPLPAGRADGAARGDGSRDEGEGAPPARAERAEAHARALTTLNRRTVEVLVKTRRRLAVRERLADELRRRAAARAKAEKRLLALKAERTKWRAVALRLAAGEKALARREAELARLRDVEARPARAPRLLATREREVES